MSYPDIGFRKGKGADAMNRSERRELERLRALVAELEKANERHFAAYRETLHRMVIAEQALLRVREELDQALPNRGQP